MIKVNTIDVWGFRHAIRSMRNPKNSWGKSDSEYDFDYCAVGPNDMDLMQRLYKAGAEHRTYARMIQVSMDIVAPLYWWKEMDRYTVGKSQVSCSTMHKIADKEFELDDFSHEHLDAASFELLRRIVDRLNAARKFYLEKNKIGSPDTKDYWWQMIQLLPSSYNQRRTVCMSYETVFKIIKERNGHKLDEWNKYVKILLKDLPYVEEIIGESNADQNAQ